MVTIINFRKNLTNEQRQKVIAAATGGGYSDYVMVDVVDIVDATSKEILKKTLAKVREGYIRKGLLDKVLALSPINWHEKFNIDCYIPPENPDLAKTIAELLPFANAYSPDGKWMSRRSLLLGNA